MKLISTDLTNTAELQLLANFHRDISALHAAFIEHHPVPWEQSVLNLRLAFRENATVEGLANLRTLYATDPDRLARMREDIEIGARNFFRKNVQEMLIGILTRAGEQITELRTKLTAGEEEWKTQSAHFFTGPVQPGEESLRLKADAELVASWLRRVDIDAAPKGFPPAIPEVLAVVGLTLPWTDNVLSQ